ncbi:MAG: AAA family ATPase, partial [Ignavibacteriaceae bacterium]|nr:AAA family ATPase [Ignavibacteriaceae bacterium]
MKTGRNVFLTGQAGSGKTYVLRQYINHLKELNASFGVTASTGIAATHMEGITIHSWSGMGIRDSLTKSDILEIADKSHVRKKIKDASVLIIDEVSMLHHYRIDIIDAIVREVKSKNEPFGGMQVVFCGDFFQLPPVSRSGERESFFAYHSDSWKNLNPKVCYLSEQHRQNDLEYLEILNSIRGANLSEKTKKSLMDRLGIKSEFSPTRLYTHNIDVDKENNLELGNISGKVFEY